MRGPSFQAQMMQLMCAGAVCGATGFMARLSTVFVTGSRQRRGEDSLAVLPLSPARHDPFIRIVDARELFPSCGRHAMRALLLRTV